MTDDPHDPPPPSYEAARAAGAAPLPPGRQQPVTIPNAQYYDATTYTSSDTNNTNTTHNGTYIPPRVDHSPSPPPSAPIGLDGVVDAIALQPLSQPAMTATGEPAQRNGSRAPKVVPLHLMSERSEWVDCQFCKKRTQTRIVKKGAKKQFLTGALICIVCICLTPLPCCLHWFEETQWICTGCNKKIAVRLQDGDIKVIPTPEETLVPSQYATNGPQQQGATVPLDSSTPTALPQDTGAAPEYPHAENPAPPTHQVHLAEGPALEQPGRIPQITVESPTTIASPASAVLGQDSFPAEQSRAQSSTGVAHATADASAQAPGHQQEPPTVTSEGDRPPGAAPLKF